YFITVADSGARAAATTTCTLICMHEFIAERILDFQCARRGRFLSGYLVHCDRFGDALQGCALHQRRDIGPRQERRRLWMLDDWLGCEDRARDRKALDAGCDVHGRAKIVKAVVEHNGKARSLVDADLEQQALRPGLIAYGGD